MSVACWMCSAASIIQWIRRGTQTKKMKFGIQHTFFKNAEEKGTGFLVAGASHGYRWANEMHTSVSHLMRPACTSSTRSHGWLGVKLAFTILPGIAHVPQTYFSESFHKIYFLFNLSSAHHFNKRETYRSRILHLVTVELNVPFNERHSNTQHWTNTGRVLLFFLSVSSFFSHCLWLWKHTN